MKKTFSLLFSALLMLILLVPQAISRAENNPEAVTKLAAAYYFYWYKYPAVHFIDPDGSDALTDHPTDAYLAPPPNYSYDDPAWHYRELTDIMTANIDVILPVYWGNPGNAYWSQVGLTKLVEAENSMIGEGKSPPKIGMFYDTTAIKDQYGPSLDLTTLDGQVKFYGMIHDFFTLVPDKTMWARINGKPVIYLYVSAYVGSYNQTTFDYVYQHFYSDFSETPFIVRETSWTGVTTDGAYSWGAAVYGPFFNGSLAAIGPGYDDSAVYGRYPKTYRSRECGNYYQDGWEQVANSSATFVAIETWNEFHEGTEITETKEYGRQFINLTAQGISAWKANDPALRPYVWADLGQYPYTQGLRAPVWGDGTWKSEYKNGRWAAYPDHLSTPDPSYYIYFNVDDLYIFGQNNVATHVWVTVEYLDVGTDHFYIEYDSAGPNDIAHQFKATNPVILQNSGLWKRATFDLSDAYFANRQQGGIADFRLNDSIDGPVNYFGRVWVFKSNPSTLHAPNLTGLMNQSLLAGGSADMPLSTADPGGGVLALSLDRAPGFISLVNNGGSYSLHIAPTETDASDCIYRVRLLLSDSTNPALKDAESISIRVFKYGLFLPAVRR